MDTETLYQYYLKSNSICTDSRKVKNNDLFFALKGDNFNGNKFAKQAIEQGAAFAIIDEVAFKKSDQYLLVENVLETLQSLAKFHRQQLMIPILAITGSNGKTTTKELLYSILSKHFKTQATKGNLNNHIGVPLTLLEIPLNTEIAIIEMGANHLKEIEFLCEIAQPTYGLITNIGKAHLEGFGGLEGVKQAKSELYNYLAETSGFAFINLDEPFLKTLAENIQKKVFYEKSAQLRPNVNIIETKLISETPFLKVAFLNKQQQIFEVQSNLVGLYNFNNIMTAIAVACYFEVPATAIKAGLEGYIPTNNRSQIIKHNTNTYFLDAYNANPSSMLVAINHFSNIKASQKIIILGDMLELGEASQIEHQQIIDFAKKKAFSQILTVGEQFTTINSKNILNFNTVANLKEWFQQQNFQNTHFLIKGSRSIQLEKLLK